MLILLHINHRQSQRAQIRLVAALIFNLLITPIKLRRVVLKSQRRSSQTNDVWGTRNATALRYAA